MKNINVKNLLEISAALSTERDFNKLFAKILKEAMDITGCDGGTLYIDNGDCLNFRIMRTKSMNVYKGENGEEISLPPVIKSEKNVCAYAAMHNEVINVPDVYSSDKYDFSGPKQYDAMTGFKTTSMLVVPMENHYGEVVGVLQLINALDGQNRIIAFDKDFEEVITALSSLAAVCITNMNHLTETKELFDSFVSAISSAIDERTPYNASHTRNMVRYGKAFLDYMNKKYIKEKGVRFFLKNQEEQFLMSVWLHDMGKMAIPTKIMNKENRLGEDIYKIESRFKQIALLNKIEYLENKITKEQSDEKAYEVKEGWKLIEFANSEGFLSGETVLDIEALANHTYIAEDGSEKKWIKPQELEMLKIQKGTLTDEERKTMENHVVITKGLLEKIKFTGDYNHVVEWASNHHEFLDGSGYPNKLKGEELTIEMRLLTVLDIFDALTATDRPYKEPIPVVKAIKILESMVKEGKLDGNLVSLFKESEAWKVNENLTY